MIESYSWDLMIFTIVHYLDVEQNYPIKWICSEEQKLWIYLNILFEFPCFLITGEVSLKALLFFFLLGRILHNSLKTAWKVYKEIIELCLFPSQFHKNVITKRYRYLKFLFNKSHRIYTYCWKIIRKYKLSNHFEHLSSIYNFKSFWYK